MKEQVARFELSLTDVEPFVALLATLKDLIVAMEQFDHVSRGSSEYLALKAALAELGVDVDAAPDAQ